MLKQMLSPDVVDGDECYEFTWVGKKASIVEANKPIRKTLRPCPEESKNWDTTENLYIEGDNLEVLKLLQEAYLGKVKMIYIDPPYNTGNDFIYADDFMRSQEEENEQMGMYDEDDNRLFKNTDTNGRFHSAWCSMMYSRLMLARNLLSNDGVLVISISDAELESLRKIADEIFGESNFCGDVIWNSTKSVTNTALISVSHTYNLIYFKSMQYFIANRSEFRLPDDGEGFSNPDNDPRGDWKADPFQVGGWRPNQQYEITNPYTGIKYKPNPGCSWKNDYAHFQELLADNRIVFGKTGEGGPQRKRFIWEAQERGKVAKTWWDDVETTTNGTQLVKKLFGGVTVFDNPKPVGLIKRFLQLSTNKESVVLDFFSGSATTAHAVMQLNAEDGGHRKFIMVQLPEPCDEQSEAYKAGYKTICEIGKERIRRAGAQILERSLESLERDGMIEKIDKSKLPVLSSKNSLGKEGGIEKYAGELSEIRSLEEVYGSGGAGVSSHQTAAAGGDLRTGRPDAEGGGFHSVEYSGGTVAGNAGVYPVFESGKGITCGAGNTVIALRSLALLNELGYRVCLERFRGDQQNACGTDQTSELQTLNSKLQALNSKLSLDTGFRVLKLDDSNMKDVYYAADDYDQRNLMDMISNIKEDRTDLDLLFGCLLDWGLPLSLPYTSEQIEGCTVHTYNDGDLIACFDANIPESVVKEIASRKPLRAVFRDSSFANSPAKINVFEIFKLYMPEDADDISKRVRVI